MQEQGIPASQIKEYQLDHVISLILGGEPRDENNLWLQKYHLIVNGEDLGASAKDKLENYLSRAVCNADISIQTAQKCIKEDWVSCYRKYLIKENYGGVDIIDEDDEN